MNKLLISVLIVLVVCIIVWLWRRPKDSRRRRKYRSSYARSNGIYDTHATHALQLIDELDEPNAQDHYLAGQIIELNIAQGRPTRQQRDQIVDRYTRALVLLRNDDPTPRDEIVHPMFLVDHIQNFAEGLDRNDLFEDELAWGGMFDLARNTRANIVEHTVADAAAKSKTKKEFARNFTADNITNTNDSQNVHDPSVGIGNRATIARIKQSSTYKTIDDVVSEIRSHAKRSEFSDEHLRRLDIVLGKMRSGGLVFTYNETESNILKYVWDRICDPKNSANSRNLKDALVTGLCDCMRPGASEPVCAVGRVSAAIGSLITLDYDDNVGVALTEEQYCNEIRNEAVNVLSRLIAEEQNSTSEEMRKVAKSYDDPNIITDAEFEKLFKRKLKDRIDALVNDYEDKLTQRKLEDVRAECYIAVVAE